jgi:hypothetical protein
MGPDLNAVTLTGEVRKPVDYSTPWSYVELAIRSGTAVTYISLHVPTPAYLHLLEELSVGDRLYAMGELAYSKSDRLESGGQHCLKIRELRRLTPNGRLLAEAPGASESHIAPNNAFVPTGERRRRRRGRRAKPERR